MKNVTPASASRQQALVFCRCQTGDAAQMRPPLYGRGQTSIEPSWRRR